MFLYFKNFLYNKCNDFWGLWVAEGDVGGFAPQTFTSGSGHPQVYWQEAY